MTFAPRGPQMPNPELAKEEALADSTPAEFTQLEAAKELRRERRVERHPWLTRMMGVRSEASGEGAPLDEGALREAAEQLQAEFPHGDPETPRDGG
jgi:hypothetical protein